MRSFYLLLPLVVLACAGQEPSADLTGPEAYRAGEVVEVAPTVHVDDQPLAMVTVTNAEVLRAGELVVVECLGEIDGELVDLAVDVDVRVYPSVELTATAGGAEFTPHNAGLYRIGCEARDGSMRDSVGTELVVEGAQVASWYVSKPSHDCFPQAQSYRFDYSAFDTYGNAVADPQVILTVVPGTYSGDLDSGIRFEAEGSYDITLELANAEAGEATAPVSFTVLVDSTPPVVDIHSPSRGAMLEQGGVETELMLVEGTISDGASPIASVQLGAADHAVSGEQVHESFRAFHASPWGVNVFAVTAEDTCGNVAHIAHTFMRSPSYGPAATHPTSEGQVDGGMIAQVSQSFIDDGDRDTVDDIATLIERALMAVDFNEVLQPGQVVIEKDSRQCGGCMTGPTFIDPGYVVRRHPDAGRQVRWQGPWLLDNQVVDGGVQFGVRLDAVEVPLHAWAELIQCSIGCENYHDVTVDARVGFDRVEAHGLIAADVTGGKARTSVEWVDFEMHGLFVDLDCGILDDVCDGFTDWLVDTLRDDIRRTLEEAVIGHVPPMMQSAFNAVSVSGALPLPEPFDVELNMVAALDALSLCGPSAGLPASPYCGDHNRAPASLGVRLNTQVYPSQRGDGIDAAARGPIQYGGQGVGFASGGVDFGMGIRVDTINQLLWSLWYGGAFDNADLLAMGGDIVPEGMEAVLDMGLPPVWTPKKTGDIGHLALPDVRLRARIDLNEMLEGYGEPEFMEIEVGVTIIVGADIAYDHEAGRLRFAMDEDFQMFIEVLSVDRELYDARINSALGQTLTLALPVALNQAVASMRLPEFDLSPLAGTPTVWRLSGANLSHAGGYVALTGEVEAR